ncbi:MAG: hypothetical protein GY841_23495 [FCB group bacterium]|nr:hypothetical protein [FCB group bacterium]
MYNMGLDYRCGKCGKVFNVASDPHSYLGPVDREDTTCNPFIEFESICGDCETGKNEK